MTGMIPTSPGCDTPESSTKRPKGERNQANKALRVSEERFRMIADSCPSMMWATNAEGAFYFINKACCQFFGMTQDELVSGKRKILYHPDDTLRVLAEFNRAVGDRANFRLEARFWQADGEWRLLGVFAEPMFSSSGEFMGHIGLCADITERVLSEKKRQFELSLIQSIHAETLEGILVVNQARIVVSYNTRFLGIWGLDVSTAQDPLPHSFIGSDDWTLMSAVLERMEDSEAVARRVQELYTHPDQEDHCEIKLKDGRTLERHSKGLKNAQGINMGRVWFFRDITPHKQAEASLQRANVMADEANQRLLAERSLLNNERRMLRALIDNIPDFMYVKDLQSRFIVANLHLARIVGVETPEELLGKTDFDFFPPEQARGFYEDEQTVIRTGQPLFNHEEKSIDGEGYESCILTTRVPLCDSQGIVTGIAGVGHDITERKTMEAALREAEENYRGFFDQSIIGVFQSSPEGRLLRVNSSLAFTFGYDSPQEMITSIADISQQFFANPKRGVELMLVMDRVGGVKNFECEAIRKDGSMVWIAMSIRAIRQGGIVIRYEGVCEDITVRKKMEEVLHNERSMLRSLIDNVPDFMYVKDAEGRFVLANASLARLNGAETPEKMLGKTDFDFYPPELASVFYEDEQKLIRSGQTLYNHEEMSPDSAGNEVHVLTTKVLLRNSNGKVTGIAGIGRNISERKEMEDKIREAEQKYRGIFDSAIIGIFQSTPEGRTLSVNQAMARTYGYDSPEEMMASVADIACHAYVDPKRREDLKLLMEKNGEAKNFEFEALRKDGGKFWIAMSAVAIRENGVVVRYEGMIQDVTERKQLQEQLLQAQKLESVGQLAAGIAHEINTPIQYVGDNVRFLRDAYQDITKLLANYERLFAAANNNSLSRETIQDVAAAVKGVDTGYLLEEIPKAIDQTLEGITRVSTIVAAMKEFSHPDTKEKIPLDLNHAINSTITVARNEWKYVAEMKTDFDTSLPLVSCLPGEFNQVILNLIVNAAHAIADVVKKGGPEKGTITVQTRNCPEWVEVRVQDSGTGIPKQVQSRIFDPFFTTKVIGKGTGQGLAIARSVIVDKHGGSIHFETEEGKGTTFIIRLPLSGKSLSAKAVAV